MLLPTKSGMDAPEKGRRGGTILVEIPQTFPSLRNGFVGFPEHLQLVLRATSKDSDILIMS